MNKQKDRLVELMEESSKRAGEYIDSRHIIPSAEEVHSLRADYLLANGVIVPPCKVGDTVYRISTRPHSRMKYVQETTISRIAIDNEGTWLFCTCNPIAKCVFGKTVFLSREEAEAKLKEGVQ